MSASNRPESDPELVEIDELAQIERSRRPRQRSLRVRSNILIVSVVLFLLGLGVGSTWIAGAF